MNPSPLQLERHFFTKVRLEANPKGKPGAANELGCEVEIGKALDDAKRFQVTLRLKLLPGPGGEACYAGEIHAVGLFRVLAGWPPEQDLTLVETNGPALLYGAARELLCNLTARGPWPQVVLTSISFVQPKNKPKVAAGRKTRLATSRL